MLGNYLVSEHFFLFFIRNIIFNIIMEIKKGSIITTKDGDYVVKDMMKLVNPFTFKLANMYLVDVDGVERAVNGDEIITVKNNHIENIEEP